MALIWEGGGREERWGMGPLVVCVGGSVVGGDGTKVTCCVGGTLRR